MAGFDIVMPVWGVIENIAYGSHHTFVISASNGHDPMKLLHRAGIKTWFHNTPDGECLTFNVKKADAPQAQEILKKNGITPESPAPKGGGTKEGKQGYQPGEGWSLW